MAPLSTWFCLWPSRFILHGIIVNERVSFILFELLSISPDRFFHPVLNQCQIRNPLFMQTPLSQHEQTKATPIKQPSTGGQPPAGASRVVRTNAGTGVKAWHYYVLSKLLFGGSTEYT